MCPTPLVNPYSPSIHYANYKTFPEDFVVNEIMSIEWSGSGEHLWLQLQKTNLNTSYVAKMLAAWASIPIKDIGYSGLKDRHAVTSQWFSLRLPNRRTPIKDFQTFCQDKLQDGEYISQLASQWHHKKLNRATHEANHFIITLREVKGEKSAIEAQLSLIKQQGVPNYFGEQRFGQSNNNLTFALQLFNTGKVNGKKLHPKFDRDKVSLYLSAARSELFNAILAKRVATGNWNTPISGEVMNLDGTNSIFLADEMDDTLIARLAQGDIHLTGALWGKGDLKSQSVVAQIEQSVIDSQEAYSQLANGLIAHGLKQQRRPLRMLPKSLDWYWSDSHTMVLDFQLPTGSFATTLLAMLIVTE